MGEGWWNLMIKYWTAFTSNCSFYAADLRSICYNYECIFQSNDVNLQWCFSISTSLRLIVTSCHKQEEVTELIVFPNWNYIPQIVDVSSSNPQLRIQLASILGTSSLGMPLLHLKCWLEKSVSWSLHILKFVRLRTTDFQYTNF